MARDTARLQQQWSKRGSVHRQRPRFLHRGERLPVFIPQEAFETGNCITVAVLAARNVSFLLVVGDHSNRQRSWPVASQAGVAQITRCGNRKTLLEALVVQMRSPRGVLETLVTVTQTPPPPIAEVVPTRNVGPSQSAPFLGPRPKTISITQRATALEQRAKRDGALHVRKSPVVSDSTGRGVAPLQLEMGCHRIDVLTDADSDGVDVDASLVDVETGEEIARDESESGQASLRRCVGRPTPVRLSYLGAASKAPALLVVTSWALPEAIPATWGALARGRIAQALGDHALPSLVDGPVYSSLGVQGTTRLPWEFEPGACYTAVVAAIRGQVQSLAMAAQAGATRRENHASRGATQAALSFCVDDHPRGLLEVQASGFGMAWLLGVWRTAPLRPTPGATLLEGGDG